MVRFQSMSRSCGRRVRAARLSAPETADRVLSATRCSISSTTFCTTIRAVALVCSGITRLRLTSVPTRWTSAWTDSSNSGSSSSWVRCSRSTASRCITCTTLVGK